MILIPTAIFSMGELFERRVRKILIDKNLTYWERLHYSIILKKFVKIMKAPKPVHDTYE
jgi:hypothetical protein